MNHFISLSTAIDMTTRFRSQREEILKAGYQNLNVLPVCETFDRTPFDVLLSKSGCLAIRIYYGMDENLKIHAIIVAVNGDNEDILPSLELTTTEEDLIDNANRCPDLCPPSSPLNS